MLNSIFTILVALSPMGASCEDLKAPPVGSQQTSLKDMDLMRRRARASADFDSARERGDLAGAWRTFKTQMLDEGYGDKLEASRICFELQNYSEAVRYLELYEAELATRKRQNASFLEMLAVQSAMIRATGQSPHWQHVQGLKAGSEIGDLVVRQVQSATAMGYLRTAAFLLDELPKLKVDPETIRLLRDRLTKRKIQIAANRTGGD